eukprot:g45595.t1
MFLPMLASLTIYTIPKEGWKPGRDLQEFAEVLSEGKRRSSPCQISSTRRSLTRRHNVSAKGAFYSIFSVRFIQSFQSSPRQERSLMSREADGLFQEINALAKEMEGGLPNAAISSTDGNK